MDTMTWYENLNKPYIAPPSYLFGYAWSILYPIIFLSFGYIVYAVIAKKFPKHLMFPLLLNVISNLLFSPIQFGLRSNFLAALDITIVLISLIWLIKKVHPHNKILAYIQVPYLLWVVFATVLQYSITWLNR